MHTNTYACWDGVCVAGTTYTESSERTSMFVSVSYMCACLSLCIMWAKGPDACACSGTSNFKQFGKGKNVHNYTLQLTTHTSEMGEKRGIHEMHQAKRTMYHQFYRARELGIFFITIPYREILRANMHTLYFIAYDAASVNYVIVRLFV